LDESFGRAAIGWHRPCYLLSHSREEAKQEDRPTVSTRPCGTRNGAARS